MKNRNDGDELPNEEERIGDNEDLGLDDEGNPFAGGYASENAAPMDPDVRDDVQGRLKGRATWESANETGDPTGNEVENGPDVDPNDPNLSATFAEAGAEERKDSVGMPGEEEFALDDPETLEDE